MAAPPPLWLRQSLDWGQRYGQNAPTDRSGSGPQGQPSPWGVNQAAMRMAAETPRYAGGPTVQVPRAERSFVNLDNEPMLFGNMADRPSNRPHSAMDYTTPTVNRPHSAMDFDSSLPDVGANAGLGDRWWEMIGGGANATPPPFVSGDAGGSVWAERSPVGGFAEAEFAAPMVEGNASEFAVADTSGIAGGITAESSPVPEEEFAFNPMPEGTGIDIEPGLLDQNSEWTTSPNDRRFLPTPRSSSGGDIQNFGGNLSLGAYLSTPLSAMRYGEGYPPVEAGRTLTSGEGTHWNSSRNQWERYNSRTGGWDAVSRENATGSPGADDYSYPNPGDPFQDWRENAESNPDALANATSNPDWRDNADGTTTFRDFIDPGPSIRGGFHWDYSQGRMVRNDNATGAQFRNSANPNFTGGAQSRMDMWYNSMGGNVNDPGVGVEEGGQRFYGGARGRINPETGAIEQIMPGDEDFYFANLPYNPTRETRIGHILMAQRNRSQSGVRGLPPVGANTRGG